MLAAVAALAPGRWLLAVSGGRDSMCLLHAVASVRPGAVAAVATFDHGTGEVARCAVQLVERTASGLGLRSVTGTAPLANRRVSEASWRSARWRFLRHRAREFGCGIVTAHTRDDQAETVLLRILRGAGARGLAGMLAEDAGRDRGAPPVLRPLLGVPRESVARYAAAHHVTFIDDPSNQDRTFARNRVRLDLLPALERVHPGFSGWLAGLGERAARWRTQVESLVDGLFARGDLSLHDDGTLVVRVSALAGLDAGAWRVLWPAIAARAGVVMDRRGIARAATWAERVAVAGTAVGVGSRIQLAAGHEMERTRQALVLRGGDGAPTGLPGTT